mmetsp:Transcript_84605/g.103704  ORF Transcript_84605/g.103704 Transcript_84605/m.103704 type:complete len:261 (+) Transcript_84605:74-856(+)|eukprot:CAMPEP_0114664644 /NCGR_PEP_ID=MMETSP0191-20121206/29192_1 /TAXON_ID=126664 /ORGANISM="Sorites sp." /LENGTH=260 /DNA_ID=CAMNT_0001907349 /DNA_START=67 /DNA_END=849 /DNA_ORIENTATION=-
MAEDVPAKGDELPADNDAVNDELKQEQTVDDADVVVQSKKDKKCKRALLIVDMQYDFMPPNGSLQVSGGDKIVKVVNDIRDKYGSKFDEVICSMDWHPKTHCSFIDNNIKRVPTAKAFSLCKLENGNDQMMWPVHCVQGSKGAKIHKDLTRSQSDKIILKGMDPSVDSYSAFMDNDKQTKTAMEGLLKEAEITDIFCVGLAYDYCVGWTALDGKALGFNSYVIKDASASVSSESEVEREQQMKDAGVNIIKVSDLENLLK